MDIPRHTYHHLANGGISLISVQLPVTVHLLHNLLKGQCYYLQPFSQLLPLDTVISNSSSIELPPISQYSPKH